ncbi:hypothetical protein [Micromonospora sp. NPDC049282]|uniref:hypothetical protein n=1 Tax=Micromonospora sp. NPDC049282 TaxID=3364269 RepID=UPI003711E057
MSRAMSRKVLALAAAAVVVVVLGLLGLWRWGPLGHDEVVPSCGDVADALPEVMAGSWTLTRAEPKREVDRSRVRCEFDFTSADQAYRGRILLSLIESDDEAFLRRTATTGPCEGEAVPNSSAPRYEVARSCARRINDKIFASVLLASDRRYAYILADFSSPGRPIEQVIAYANLSAQHITDQAMTLDATD